MEVDFRNLSFEHARRLTDAEILRIELGDLGGQNISDYDAAKMSDADIYAMERVTIPEKDQIPIYPPQIIDTRPIQVPQVKNTDRINLDGHHISDNDDVVEMLTDDTVKNLPDEYFFIYRLRHIAFLRKMELEDTRYKFTILVDYSLGMFNDGFNKIGQKIFDVRWAEAKVVVSSLVPKVTKFNDVGVSLHFFSSGKFVENENVRTSEQSIDLFNNGKIKAVMKGVVNIATILQRLLDSRSTFEPISILILTGGNTTLERQAPLIDLILSTEKKLDRASQLKLSFVQVGDDETSTAFLQALLPTLLASGMQKNIVDVTTHQDLRGRKLAEVLGCLFNSEY